MASSSSSNNSSDYYYSDYSSSYYGDSSYNNSSSYSSYYPSDYAYNYSGSSSSYSYNNSSNYYYSYPDYGYYSGYSSYYPDYGYYSDYYWDDYPHDYYYYYDDEPRYSPPKTYSYPGGNMTITDYAGEEIFIGELPPDANFTGNDFHFYLSTGELVITNALDKMIDFRNVAGGEFAKAYAVSTPMVIDGRTMSGFDYFVGSAAGSNTLIAGNSGSRLWGNTGGAMDLLVGGAGLDTFFVGKNEGNDAIQNASAADSVNLYDVRLSDITFTAEENNVIGIALNTGNVLTIQSTQFLSAKINLADGTSWRYNHDTKSWQGA